MKLKEWLKILFIGTCVVALVGCHTKRKTDQSAINEANADVNHHLILFYVKP